jgi:RNA polymerase sigma factor (sigma-70 family)
MPIFPFQAMNYTERIHDLLDGMLDTSPTIEDDGVQIPPSGTAKYKTKELSPEVITALELLEDEYRETLILREYDGFSYHEIAEMTGTTEVNVRTRVFRAKQQLYTILQPYFDDK